MTKVQIIEAVEQFSKDLSVAPVDISFVCIMSHGDKDYLRSHDDKEVYPEEDILEKFSKNNCRGMSGLPKMFLIQSCRGGNTETKRDDAQANLPSVGFTSTLRDAIIAYSTVPSFVSYRSPSSQGGAWFIQAFCKGFGQATSDMEVQQLFKYVSQELSAMQTDAQEKQTMEVTYRCFEKDLFLKPAQARVLDHGSFLLGWVMAMFQCKSEENTSSASSSDKMPFITKDPEADNETGRSLFSTLYEMENKKNIAQKEHKEAVNQVTKTWHVLQEAWEQLLEAKNDLGIVFQRISQEDYIQSEHEYDLLMMNH